MKKLEDYKPKTKLKFLPYWIKKEMQAEIYGGFIQREEVFKVENQKSLVVVSPQDVAEPFDEYWTEIEPRHDDSKSFISEFDMGKWEPNVNSRSLIRQIGIEGVNNRKEFAKGKEKLDFVPSKYFHKVISGSMSKYDHPMMYQDNDYDYLVISNYSDCYEETLLREGFKIIPHIYNSSCISYMKMFNRTRSSKITEATF